MRVRGLGFGLGFGLGGEGEGEDHLRIITEAVKVYSTQRNGAYLARVRVSGQREG